MAPRVDPNSLTPKRSRAERARQYLTAGAVFRDDSDDELGLVDHEWEWIYDGEECSVANGITQDELEGKEEVETPSRRKKNPKTKRIIRGARMGSFECKIGDTVLLKSPEAGKAWVGIILHFLEDEEHGKAANFMWSSSESEITEKHKRKRTDFLPQELYLTPAFDVNGLAAINGKATVCSKENFFKKFPTVKAPTRKRKLVNEYSKWFVCRRACNTRTVTYTDEFIWEEYFPGGENVTVQDLLELVDRVTYETKLSRKRKADTDVSISRAFNFILLTMDSSMSKKQKTLRILQLPGESRKQPPQLPHPNLLASIQLSPLPLTNVSSSRRLSNSHLSVLESYRHQLYHPRSPKLAVLSMSPPSLCHSLAARTNSQPSIPTSRPPSPTAPAPASTSQASRGQEKLPQSAKQYPLSTPPFSQTNSKTSYSSKSMA